MVIAINFVHINVYSNRYQTKMEQNIINYFFLDVVSGFVKYSLGKIVFALENECKSIL